MGMLQSYWDSPECVRPILLMRTLLKNATILFHKIMRRFSLPCMLNIKLACGLSVFNRPLLSLAMCFYLCLCVQTWWGRWTALCSVGGALLMCLGGFSGGCFSLLFVCECTVTLVLQELFILIRMSSGIESDINILFVVYTMCCRFVWNASHLKLFYCLKLLYVQYI